MRRSTWLALTIACCALGCATGGAVQGDDGGGDATAPKDGGASDSGNCPTGRTGPNCQNCASGFHACGSNNCEQDHPNTPDVGCSKGCNKSVCPNPTNGTAKCTAEGLCDFACNTSFDKSDAGCDCPSGQMGCGATCQQCCVDTDCVGHQLCNSGTCSGCQPNWADCNNNTSDGCESDLSKEPNCGSCGTSCCGWGVSCCFTDFHGKSCKASGNSYSCQC